MSDESAREAVVWFRGDHTVLQKLLQAEFPPCRVIRQGEELQACWAFTGELDNSAESVGRVLQARYGGLWKPETEPLKPPSGGAHCVFERSHRYVLNDILAAAEPKESKDKYDIAELKKALPFKQLVGETHQINREGKVLCPFHADRTPNCHIYDDHFYCFSCQATGDHIDWLAHVGGLEVKAAIEELARRVGGYVPEARKKLSAEVKTKQQKDSEGRKKNIARELEAYYALPKQGVSPYLQDKGLEDDGDTRYGSDSTGAYAAKLIVNTAGQATGIQRLYADQKKFVWGSRTRGNFIRVGNLSLPVIFVGEGYATARSAELATNRGSVAGLSANNLKAVGLALRKKFPTCRLIFLAEHSTSKDDNIGLESAKEAAEICQGSYILPRFDQFLENWQGEKPPTDFDDLRRVAGLEEVANQLAPFLTS